MKLRTEFFQQLLDIKAFKSFFKSLFIDISVLNFRLKLRLYYSIALCSIALGLLFHLSISSATAEKPDTAVEPQAIATYNSWKLYTKIEEGRKICFIVASPIEKYGNYSKRSIPNIWVRHINNSINEVSLTVGYPYKINSYPEVGIYWPNNALNKSNNFSLNNSKDNKEHDNNSNNKDKNNNRSFLTIRDNFIESARQGKCYFTQEDNSYIFDIILGEQAWVKDVDYDEELVHDMKKGLYLVVTATSPKNTCSLDVYSLAGFTKAYTHMKELCKNVR